MRGARVNWFVVLKKQYVAVSVFWMAQIQCSAVCFVDFRVHIGALGDCPANPRGEQRVLFSCELDNIVWSEFGLVCLGSSSRFLCYNSARSWHKATRQQWTPQSWNRNRSEQTVLVPHLLTEETSNLCPQGQALRGAV